LIGNEASTPIKEEEFDGNSPPYSLGKLIDWKLDPKGTPDAFVPSSTPYSLGKLIDWKQ